MITIFNNVSVVYTGKKYMIDSFSELMFLVESGKVKVNHASRNGKKNEVLVVELCDVIKTGENQVKEYALS